MSVFRRLHRGDLAATVSKLLVATSDSSDALVDDSVPETLRAIRDDFGLDVVFVSEFADGQRVVRYVDATARAPELPRGASDPLEASVCQRIVDGRLPELIRDVAALPEGSDLPALPFPIGAHMSTPIVLDDGRTYGTLCCFSQAAHPLLRESDLQLLRQGARLVARKLAQTKRRAAPPPEEWTLEPIDEGQRRGGAARWKLP